MRDLRLGFAFLRRHHPHNGARRRGRPRGDRRGARGRQRCIRAKEGRPCRRAVHDLLRRVLLLQARLLLGLRVFQPERSGRVQALGSLAGGPVQLFALAGRLLGRSGRISARAVCRCRPDEGAGGPHGRAGAVPVRHFPDRLYGGGELRNPRRRDHRRIRLRPCRTVRDPQCFPARRGAGDCDSTPCPSAWPWRRTPGPSASIL